MFALRANPHRIKAAHRRRRRVASRVRLPGQYFDQETGLNYNYFRDYEPGTGRYVESDPLGLDGGLATYSYVYSDPLDLTDKFGLSPHICCRLLGDPENRSALDFILGVILRQRHCYIDNDGDVYSLALKNGVGFKYRPNAYKEDTDDVLHNYPSTKCKECKKKDCAAGDPGACLKKAYGDYPGESDYFFLGPNSNTFAGTLFRSCCAGNGSGLGSAPGFNHKPGTSVQQ